MSEVITAVLYICSGCYKFAASCMRYVALIMFLMAAKLIINLAEPH